MAASPTTPRAGSAARQRTRADAKRTTGERQVDPAHTTGRRDLNARPARTFETALLRGEAVGFVVATTPQRFALLPGSVAAAFAEVGVENCYHVFETRADARRHLRQVPAADRLGWIHQVRKVVYFPGAAANHGPKLDVRGHPFAMRGFIVDKSGVVSEWNHGGRFGWRRPPETAESVPPSKPTPQPRAGSRVRRILS